jgi:hypothetical protein
MNIKRIFNAIVASIGVIMALVTVRHFALRSPDPSGTGYVYNQSGVVQGSSLTGPAGYYLGFCSDGAPCAVSPPILFVNPIAAQVGMTVNLTGVGFLVSTTCTVNGVATTLTYNSPTSASFPMPSSSDDTNGDGNATLPISCNSGSVGSIYKLPNIFMDLYSGDTGLSISQWNDLVGSSPFTQSIVAQQPTIGTNPNGGQLSGVVSATKLTNVNIQATGFTFPTAYTKYAIFNLFDQSSYNSYINLSSVSLTTSVADPGFIVWAGNLANVSVTLGTGTQRVAARYNDPNSDITSGTATSGFGTIGNVPARTYEYILGEDGSDSCDCAFYWFGITNGVPTTTQDNNVMATLQSIGVTP